ncbi:glycosyltransferase, partial [Candidatus Bathyarchaeota archaeon]|nr:glycosyltransferase [Candidatus Bathyarchaeota archaeon]
AMLLQLSLTDEPLYWVANCPDILVLPFILRRKPYILEYRSPWPVEIKREFGEGLLTEISRRMEKLALRNAKYITLTTSKLKERTTIKKPVFIIPNYPQTSFIAASKQAKKFIEKENPAGDKIVLFIGRLSTVEGADILPRIANELVKHERNISIWIVGDGPLLPALEKALGNKSKVRFYGWQKRERIPLFIEASDVCIVPRHESRYSKYYNEEGLQKLSEYMFYKKPIVACGIADSDQYKLVKESELVQGIMEALDGKAPTPMRRTWEEKSKPVLFELMETLITEYKNQV